MGGPHANLLRYHDVDNLWLISNKRQQTVQLQSTFLLADTIVQKIL